MAGIPRYELIKSISNKLSDLYGTDSDLTYKYLSKANLLDILHKEQTEELKKDIEIFCRNEKIKKIRGNTRTNL